MYENIWLLGILNYCLGFIPWPIIFIFIRYTGVRLYHLKNKDLCRRIQRKLSSNCTHTLDNNMGAGYAMGKWFLIKISLTQSECGEYYDIWLISTKKTYDNLVSSPNDEKNMFVNTTNNKSRQEKTEDDNATIYIWEKSGSFSNTYYCKRNICISKTGLVPNEEQREILQDITTHYKKNKSTIAYIHGPPGVGKTLLGLLLARDMNCHFCNTTQPWIPGDSISILYNDCEPTFETPLIIVFDEFDMALSKIHQGISNHANIPIRVQDKTGWNRMLDEFRWGLYPHVIVLLISNHGPDYIHAMDPSYVRNGRVNLFFPMVGCGLNKED